MTWAIGIWEHRQVEGQWNMANGSILVLTITNFASCPDYHMHGNRKLTFKDENESPLSKWNNNPCVAPADVRDWVKWGVFRWQSHWRVVNFRFVCRVATWICAISLSTGYCGLKELVFVERGPRRALNQFSCAEANWNCICHRSLGPTNSLLLSIMAISSCLNRQTQRHSPLNVSKSRLRTVCSNLKNHTSVVTNDDEAAIGVF